MAVKHEFDQFAQNYRSVNDTALALSGHSSAFFAEYKAKKLAQWLPELTQQPIHILDFGCGDGVMTQYVHTQFTSACVYGIDPSSDSITIAQEQFPRIQFGTSHGLVIDFPDASFDVVYAAGTFHHISFDQHAAYIKEIFRVLKPNGTFVLFELNPLNPVTRYIFKRNPIDQHAQMMSYRYAQKLVQSYGTMHTYHYGFFPKALQVLVPTERFLTAIPLGALYACVVEKKRT